MSDFIVHSIPGQPVRTFGAGHVEREEGAVSAGAGCAGFDEIAGIPGAASVRPRARDRADGFRLYETQAILRYLDRVLPRPALTPAGCSVTPRGWDQVVNINDWYLFHGVGDVIYFHRVIGPRCWGSHPTKAAIEAAMPKAHAVFDELARLLGARPISRAIRFRLRSCWLRRRSSSLRRRRKGRAGRATCQSRVVAEANAGSAEPDATTWERVSAMAEAA